jgi:hypothetical protein
MAPNRSARSTAARISKGREAPQHLGKKTKEVLAQEAISQSQQKAVKGWERNRDKIQEKINEKVFYLRGADANIKTQEFWVRKIIRHWGGDTSQFKDFLAKVPKK